MKFSLRFAWYDLWIGAYYARDTRTLYVCPVPCVLLALDLRRPRRESAPAHLRPASSWACEHCGRDNFITHISVEGPNVPPVPEEAGQLLPYADGFEWLMCPDEVTCKYCRCVQSTRDGEEEAP